MSTARGTSEIIEPRMESKGNKRNLIDIICAGKKCIWNKKVPGTNLEQFKALIREKYHVKIDSYWDLHKWSVNNFENFWAEVWEFFGIISSRRYDRIIDNGRLFTDIEWFPGARLNYAENMMKYRDDKIALIYEDEEGHEEHITFAELHEKVRLYAAALKAHGVNMGDTVACYMSNRLEAVFAMLAATSMGAIFGGPLPFYGAQAATNIMKLIKPKILFTVDRFIDDGVEFSLLENLPQITQEVQELKKVVIVTNSKEEILKDISDIEKSCLLQEFLESGVKTDGTVPELIFEQLPFNHPVSVNFTSGTSGHPKGLFHSFGMLLYSLVIYGLHCNIRRDDITLQTLPVGWNVWNYFLSNLALGSTMFLYSGSPYFLTKTYFWDLLAKHKVTNTFVVTSIVDKLDRDGFKPGPGCNTDPLRMVLIGGSPVKLQNVDYFKKYGPNDLFVGGLYGSTETAGSLTGYDLNEPVYSGELQCPALGVDLRCIDQEGNHVVGERGEIVIAKPLPSLPVHAIGEANLLEDTYFSKFPGLWAQHDEAWFDPVTGGFVVTGRTDETLNPAGERFGPSDIYYAIHMIEELADYLCVGQYNNEGDERVILFVKLKKGYELTDDLTQRIKANIEQELTTDFVPAVILKANDIPYNLNNKRMELLVKKIIAENKVPNVQNVKNFECLESFCNVPELQGY